MILQFGYFSWANCYKKGIFFSHAFDWCQVSLDFHLPFDKGHFLIVVSDEKRITKVDYCWKWGKTIEFKKLFRSRSI